jgi:hypothetical protein
MLKNPLPGTTPAPGTLDGLGFKQLVPGALGNYIGPGWSNGELQESVEWGSSDPQDELDLAAYYHDSAYAKYKDAAHREAADRRFMRDTKQLTGDLAVAARNAVLYGNHVKNKTIQMVENMAVGKKIAGPIGEVLGLVYSGAKNTYEIARGLHGGYERDDKDIDDYYATDPHKRQKMFAPKEAVNDIPQNKVIDVGPTKGNSDKTDDFKAKETKAQELASKRALDRARIEARNAKPNSPPAAAPSAHMSGDQAAIINDPRSFFKRIFKRKKKKHNSVVPQINEETIEKQRKLFAHHQELKRQAENSKLKPSSDLKAMPFGYDSRIKRAYSTKRAAQIGR